MVFDISKKEMELIEQEQQPYTLEPYLTGFENVLFKQQEITHTIEPSIKEIERFLLFLNDKFKLGLSFDNITILISQAHPNTLGFFSPNGFENTKQVLNGLVLNSIHLKKHPYETITHELGHYYNNQKGIKDCSNGRHNKHFKAIAERLFLEVQKLDWRGFAYTRETPQFLEMLKEFNPNPLAFHINQIHHDKTKTKTRLYKWTCGCGYIIRCGDRSLKARCEFCNTEFKQEDTNED